MIVSVTGNVTVTVSFIFYFFALDLLNDIAEHRCILKTNQNTYFPRFTCYMSFPEKRKDSLKQVFRIHYTMMRLEV